MHYIMFKKNTSAYLRVRCDGRRKVWLEFEARTCAKLDRLLTDCWKRDLDCSPSLSAKHPDWTALLGSQQNHLI